MSRVISSFSATMTSSVIGLTMLARLTRPRIDLGQAHLDLLAAVDDALGDALGGAAVVQRDDDVLGDVGQLTGEVPGVGRLEGRVGQALAGAVGAGEVLEHREALAEVGLDGRLDDLAGGLGHQASHAAELAHLLDAAAGTGVGHQEDRVHVGVAAVVALEAVHHRGGDLLACVRPGVEHRVVAFHLGDDAALEELVELQDGLLGVADDPALGVGRDQVVGAEGEPAEGAPFEAELVHIVQQLDGLAAAEDLVAVADDLRELTGPEGDVVVGASPGGASR